MVLYFPRKIKEKISKNELFRQINKEFFPYLILVSKNILHNCQFRYIEVTKTLYETNFKTIHPPYSFTSHFRKKLFISPFILKVIVLSTFGLKDNILRP